jgi:hypothetical protein
MIRFRNFLPLAAILVGAAVLGAPARARATFEMHLHSAATGADVVITDNGAGDLNPALGVITFSGAVGNFAINVNTGESKPVLGSATAPQMDLNFLATKLVGSPADTLTVEISDQGFLTSPLSVGGQVGGTFSGSVTGVTALDAFDNGNTLFGTAGGSKTATFTSSPFSGTLPILPVTGATPYSLTERVVITAGAGAGTTSGDFEINSVPAPAGLVLALAALPVLGLGAWVRRRRVPIPA